MLLRCVCVCGGGGGVEGKRDFEKKNREQDYAISNQYWVCKFVEMGWDMFLNKNREIIVLRRINLWGGGVATLLKIGLKGILVRYFVKTETVFGCRNNNNLLILQDFF